MKRLVMFLVLFSLLVGGGLAQSPASKTGIITAYATTCTATACVSLQIPANSSSATIQLTNTFVGTVRFEISPDGVTYAAILGTPIPSGTAVSSATSTGLWRFQVAGLTWIRARASAYTSGQIGVRINTTLGVSQLNTSTGGQPVAGSGTANTIAKFTVTGSVIGDSALTDDGSVLAYQGLVGIGTGTTTPARPLEVMNTNASYPSARFSYSSAYYLEAGYGSLLATYPQAGGTNFTLGVASTPSGAGHELRLQTSGSDRLTILSGGNVGIGTATPGLSTKLQVAGLGLFTGGSIDPSDGTPTGVMVGYQANITTGFIDSIHTATAVYPLALNPSGGFVRVGTTVTTPTKFYVNGGIGFGSYTDTSNYEYGSLIQTAGAVTLAANTLGTGTDNIDIVLTPAGTGKIKTGGNSGITASGTTCTITAITNGIITGATCI